MGIQLKTVLQRIEVEKRTSMARSTFRMLFYVNDNKEKTGIVAIMEWVIINGTAL